MQLSHTDAMAVQLEKGMSEVLRGAAERDGQMPSAANDGHTPTAEPLRSGGKRIAGVCWAGPGNTSLVRPMRFPGG